MALQGAVNLMTLDKAEKVPGTGHAGRVLIQLGPRNTGIKSGAIKRGVANMLQKRTK